MALMNLFCFCCSVRLGTIVAGFVSMIQAIVPLTYLWIDGPENLRENTIYFQQHINEYHQEANFDSLMFYLKTDAESFLMILFITLSVYIGSCLLAIIGSYKLYKWLLIPYIILELGRLMILFTIHCVAMIILKKKINLGVLIGLTVAGSFLLLLLLYIWACVVTMFHIIIIVSSKSYKNLYGDDPLAPYPAPSDTNGYPLKLRKHMTEKLPTVSEVEQSIGPKNEYWQVQMKNQFNNRFLTNETATLVTQPASILGNTFTNQFHEAQYRNVRNNYLKHRGYGYY